MGSDVPGEQRLQGFEPLRYCGGGGLDRCDFPGPAEGQLSGSNQRRVSRLLRTGDYNVLICGNSNRNPDLGTYWA
jgi:hypothetical protein